MGKEFFMLNASATRRRQKILEENLDSNLNSQMLSNHFCISLSVLFLFALCSNVPPPPSDLPHTIIIGNCSELSAYPAHF